LLDQRFGIGRIKVICPITDPFVRHHGSLGGFVRIHVLDDLDHAEVRDWVRSLPGVHKALLRDEACRLLDLPYEREGDVTVLAARASLSAPAAASTSWTSWQVRAFARMAASANAISPSSCRDRSIRPTGPTKPPAPSTTTTSFILP
jgi:hypothetical protein